jgi:hypothetical protein
MARQYILIFVILVELYACNQRQDKLSEIVTNIAKCNVVMGSEVGYGGERPEQWDRYEALRSIATEQELLALTNDTNGVVRCYAFQALAARKTTDMFPVVIKHLSDTATIETLSGCLGRHQKAGDFFLELIERSDNDGWFFQLNEKQQDIIDSLLIFQTGHHLEARDKLLAKMQPREKYYEAIRQIATIENNELAMELLSKYRKQQDKPLIEALLKDPNTQVLGFALVHHFPDSSFFSYIQQALENDIAEIKKNNTFNSQVGSLYQVIVQYKDQPSRKLLEFALNEIKGTPSLYNLNYMREALELYPDPIYNGLIKPVHILPGK